jgi:hypothetical protein
VSLSLSLTAMQAYEMLTQRLSIEDMHDFFKPYLKAMAVHGGRLCEKRTLLI